MLYFIIFLLFIVPTADAWLKKLLIEAFFAVAASAGSILDISKYCIAILVNVRYRYLMVSRYFDISYIDQSNDTWAIFRTIRNIVIR